MATFSPSVLTRRLEGKVALVTVGAVGVGECTAKVFFNHGAKVVIADNRDELGQSVIKQIGASNSTYIHRDVTNEDRVRTAVDKMFPLRQTRHHGQQRRHYIVDPHPTPADFERVLAMNVTSIFLSIKHARYDVPSTRRRVQCLGSAAPPRTLITRAVVGLTRKEWRIVCRFMGVFYEFDKEIFGVDDAGFEEAMSSMANLKGTTLKRLMLQMRLFFLRVMGI